MICNITALPLEILVQIVSYLNLEDFVNLKWTGKEIFEALHGEGINRKGVRRLIRYSKEAQLAEDGEIKYTNAIHRAFCRREAFALARPSSALLLGFGSSFLYRDGILCYLHQETIRILDVHGVRTTERVFGFEWLGLATMNSDARVTGTELVHYQDRMLTLKVVYNARYHPQLVVLSTEDNISHATRVRLVINGLAPRIWVRNDSRYLFVGSHDGLGDDGYHEWKLTCWDLSLSSQHAHKCVQLKDLFGIDIGQTVSFEIYDGFFYAICNQSSAEVEEIDWTSYYHCYRFPLEDPSPQSLEPKQLWRRQHREGVIHDSWTELSLQKDECTGNPLITECRREWKDGGSVQRRTYYLQPLIYPYTPEQVPDHRMLIPAAPSDLTSAPPEVPSMRFPPGDPLIGLLDENSRPLYEAAHQRIDQNCQSEYPDDVAMSRSKSFILAKTKYRAYNSSCSAFLDLVIDDDDHPRGQWTQQIRLRVGSRIQSSPLNTEGLLHQPLLNEIDGVPIEDSENRFTNRGINIWPRANAPEKLLDLLNPLPGPEIRLKSQRAIGGGVRAVSDERSIIYLAKESSEPENAIVLVNFDPWMRFEGLTDMKLDASPLVTDESTRKVNISDKEMGLRRGQDLTTKLMNESSAEIIAKSDHRPVSFQEEAAMYLDIGRGFRFI